MNSRVIGRGTKILIFAIVLTIGAMSVNIILMPDNNTHMLQ